MTLVGYWPLNEDSGDKAYDHSGNENHGTINNSGDSTVPGAKGPLDQDSYSFNGSNDYVDLGGSDFFDLNAPFTLSGWIWIDSSHPNLSDEEWNLLGKYDGSDGWIFRHWRDGLHLYYSGTEYTTKNYNPNRETWHHWTIKHDGSNLDFFINGELFDSLSISNSTTSSTQTLKIGQRGDDRLFTTGKISEVRIYNRPLTKSEVQYLHSVGQRGLQTTSKKAS